MARPDASRVFLFGDSLVEFGEGTVEKRRASKSLGMRIRNGKKRGEWAELCFAMRAIEQGLRLSRPWGECAGYDFAVEQWGRFMRVQVKSTMFRESRGYSCSMKDSRGPYRRNAFDFVAAYVIPEDAWYIIPAKKVRGKWSIHLNPKLEKAKYSAYQEAWNLLGNGPKPGWVRRIDACVDVEYSTAADQRRFAFLAPAIFASARV